MRLGIAQIDTTAGDLAHTSERVVACARLAADRGCDLLIFPLATISGPTGVPYAAQEVFRLESIEALRDAASELACPCVVPFVAGTDEVGPAVELFLVGEGMVRSLGGNARASDAPFDGVVPTEERWRLICSVGGLRLYFCFAYEELDALGGTHDAGGYDAVVFVSGYGYAVNDPASALGAALGDGRYPLDARAANTWLVGVGSLGGYGSQVFSGSSFVLAPDGRPLALAPAFEEDLIVAEVGSASGSLDEGTSRLSFEPYDEPLHLWQTLALGLTDYVRKTGRQGVAFVYDGSLAARALAALATDALGPVRVRMLLAPGLDAADRREADSLARALRMSAVEDLGERMGTPGEGGLSADGYAAGSLFDLVSEGGHVALSARDKTALALEMPAAWDRVAELLPLGDVYRSDLVDMLHVRNAITLVLPAIDVRKRDLPVLGSALAGDTPEELLADIDLVLERHLEGEQPFASLRSDADAYLAPTIDAVLGTYATRAREPRLGASVLIASTCTIGEARMPEGFAWHDAGRTAPATPEQVHDVEVREEGREQVSSVRRMPSGAAFEGGLREALDLLRDISVGSGTDWRNPFSEN